MKRLLATIVFIGILIQYGCSWAACPQGTHPVIGPIRCTPTGCTGGETRCVIGQGHVHRALYDHANAKLWDWTPETWQVGNIDLRAA